MLNLNLELKINSASNLVNVNLFTKMDVYTVITIKDQNTRKKQKAKTTIDRSGGSHPAWDQVVVFSINERLVREGRLTLIMRLISRRILGNRDIGRVKVPLLELLNSTIPPVISDGNNQEMKLMMYQVRNQSGKRSGSLNFSYRFKPDSPTIVNRSLVQTTYPLPPPIEHPASTPEDMSFEFPKLSQYPNNSEHQKHPFATGSSNDPLPISYGDVMTEQPYLGLWPYDKSGHATPPPSHQGNGLYGYAPPSPPGNGYGSPSCQHQREVGFGLGLGAGLVGGLMMGDLVSDVANCFDL
ncbi:Protein SRC2 [Cardamine amara subsp. amara]|uniref:Protein SRC2 n=1 Tax=Cardamine amara subsp. amara TaxID=228776 RepID=A0ABD0Z9E2_CARAN